MKRKFRFLSAITCIVVLVVNFPMYSKAESMSAAEYWATANTTDLLYYDYVKDRIDTIMSEYLVPGTYWNHVGLSEWNQYTTTNMHCPDTVTIDGVEYLHNYGDTGYEKVREYCGCNCFETSFLECRDFGFVDLFSYGVFGNKSEGQFIVEDGELKYVLPFSYITLDDLCVGDVISEPFKNFKGQLSVQLYVVVNIEDDDISVVTCNPEYHSPNSTIAAPNINTNCLIYVDHWSLEKLKEIDFPTTDVSFFQYYIKHNNRNFSNQTPQNPDFIEGKDCSWNEFEGKYYWFEGGYKQGTYDDPQGVIGDGTVRGREIFDAASNGWYWLDSVYGGAKAVGKEVWMPYIYQNEADWDEETMRSVAYESDEGMGEFVLQAMLSHTGKWVRYDENGAMLKGWVTIEGALAKLYPDQTGNTYYYDHRTGLMAKGLVTIDGVNHYFDEISGVMQW